MLLLGACLSCSATSVVEDRTCPIVGDPIAPPRSPLRTLHLSSFTTSDSSSSSDGPAVTSSSANDSASSLLLDEAESLQPLPMKMPSSLASSSPPSPSSASTPASKSRPNTPLDAAVLPPLRRLRCIVSITTGFADFSKSRSPPRIFSAIRSRSAV